MFPFVPSQTQILEPEVMNIKWNTSLNFFVYGPQFLSLIASTLLLIDLKWFQMGDWLPMHYHKNIFLLLRGIDYVAKTLSFGWWAAMITVASVGSSLSGTLSIQYTIITIYVIFFGLEKIEDLVKRFEVHKCFLRIYNNCFSKGLIFLLFLLFHFLRNHKEAAQGQRKQDEGRFSHNTIKLVINMIWCLNNFLVDALNIFAAFAGDCDFIGVRDVWC